MDNLNKPKLFRRKSKAGVIPPPHGTRTAMKKIRGTRDCTHQTIVSLMNIFFDRDCHLRYPQARYKIFVIVLP